MADQNITALPVTTAPETSDQLMIVGATEEKLIDYEKLADAILTKLTSKTFALNQGTMTLLQALNELNSKPSIRYTNGTFSPIYSTNLDSGTAQYDLSKYSPNSILLIFYANGGMSTINVWGGSYSLTEIRKATNGVEISCDYSTKKMSVIVPEKAATILSIIQIK